MCMCVCVHNIYAMGCIWIQCTGFVLNFSHVLLSIFGSFLFQTNYLPAFTLVLMLPKYPSNSRVAYIEEHKQNFKHITFLNRMWNVYNVNSMHFCGYTLVFQWECLHPVFACQRVCQSCLFAARNGERENLLGR